MLLSSNPNIIGMKSCQISAGGKYLLKTKKHYEVWRKRIILDLHANGLFTFITESDGRDLDVIENQ